MRGLRFAFLAAFRTDLESLTFRTPFDAALRTTDSFSLIFRFPTVSDALLMSAGLIFFSLNSTEAAFWRAGAIVRVAASADSPHNTRDMTPAAIHRGSRKCIAV